MSKMNEVLITKNILSSLESIPFHNHIDCIKRLVPDTFPLHLAIHEVTDMKGAPEEYCDFYSHDDVAEVNLIYW